METLHIGVFVGKKKLEKMSNSKSEITIKMNLCPKSYILQK